MSASRAVSSAVVAAGLLMVPAIAAAQTEPVHSRVEIGLQVSAAPEGWTGAVGPRVDIRFGERRSLEIVGSFRGGTSDHFFTGSYTGSYSLLYKRRLGNPESRARWFYTAGGMGFIRRKAERHYSYVANGNEHRGAYTRPRFTPPLLPVGGFGVERAIHRRVGLRADVQFLLVVPTAHAGIYVPLGGR